MSITCQYVMLQSYGNARTMLLVRSICIYTCHVLHFVCKGDLILDSMPLKDILYLLYADHAMACKQKMGAKQC